jgi:glycerol-3-phosphate acyltransferase PlsY
VPAALVRMHDAGIHALLGQALSAILAFAGHSFSCRFGRRGDGPRRSCPADP